MRVPQEFLCFIPLAKFLFLKGEKGLEIGLFVCLVETSAFVSQSILQGENKQGPRVGSACCSGAGSASSAREQGASYGMLSLSPLGLLRLTYSGEHGPQSPAR